MPSPTAIRSTDAMSCRPCTIQQTQPVTLSLRHIRPLDIGKGLRDQPGSSARCHQSASRLLSAVA